MEALLNIWHFAVGLICRIPPRQLCQLNAWAMALQSTPIGQELWCVEFDKSTSFSQLSKLSFGNFQCASDAGSHQALNCVKGLANTFGLDPHMGKNLVGVHVWQFPVAFKRRAHQVLQWVNGPTKCLWFWHQVDRNFDVWYFTGYIKGAHPQHLLADLFLYSYESEFLQKTC